MAQTPSLDFKVYHVEMFPDYGGSMVELGVPIP